jgi:hypothetical protein
MYKGGQIMYRQFILAKKLLAWTLCISVFICIYALHNTDISSAADFTYGDVNGDDSVDSIDLSLMKQYLLRKISDFPGVHGKSAADLDLNNSIDAIDLSNLQQFLLGKIKKLPIKDVTPMPTTTINVTPTPIPTPTVKTTPTTIPEEETVIPSFASLQTNAKLPDPFLFKTGSKKGTRITNRNQWTSRRAEISALAQSFEFGVKPPKPQTVTGSLSGNSITVTCSQNQKSISFRCSIQLPKTGKAPYPAMIGVNMNTLNTAEILNLGIALITFPADEIGQETNAGSRGKGKFFDLYGKNYDAGALITWAWGVDRLIDALEMTPSAQIDPTKLGVTGGSRNGKGALAIGAFDERIALTVPQESGNGGASGWRTADAQQAAGQNVQTLAEIITENCWFSKAFDQFSQKTNKLPFDHHEILALCAPRGLLVIENPDFEWLGNLSCFNISTVAHMIYEALGVPDNMGYSSIGGHGHCQFPSSQQPELTAYIKKFLLGDSSNTKVFRSDKNHSFDKAKWIDWQIQELQ